MKKFVTVAAAIAAFGFVNAASAADMPTKAPAPMMAPVYNWTGFYLGVQVGYGWARSHTQDVSAAGAIIAQADPNNNGVFGGLHGGYNWQMNNIVVGIEADINAANMNATQIATNAAGVLIPPNNHVATLRWFGSVRGRLGVAMGSAGNWLPYITGGPAFGNPTYQFNHVGDQGSLTDRNLAWTGGAGIEYGISRNLTARVEYRYTNYGSVSGNVFVLFPTERLSGSMRTNDVRGGLTYRF